MIHVKDYGTLEAPPPNPRGPSPLIQQLRPMIGKQITVFVDSGGCRNNSFTGVLVEVFPDRINLLTCPSSRPGSPCGRIGTKCQIMAEHISAVTYNYL